MSSTIYQRVAEYIAAPSSDDDAFGALALAVFTHQYDANPVYRRFCHQRACTPAAVRRWTQIPLVPTAAFKLAALVCGPPAAAELEFHSSGTTRGAAARSRHHIPHAALYHAALERQFRACVLPDGARLPMLILAPPPDQAPRSSLVQMLERLRTTVADGGRYFIGPAGLDHAGLATALAAAERAAQPVLLAGITVALLEAAERLAAAGRRFRLAPGSRIMDTGGLKNSALQLDRAAIETRFADRFGVAPTHIVNEYGMTEMGSQLYDRRLVDHVAGRLPAAGLVGPPWLRTRVLDPDTLAERPEGELGLLAQLDLANCGSVAAILTDDLGRRTPGGIALEGRVRGAEPRGCALLLDEFQPAASAPRA
jgi:hypothetical protein